VIREQRMEVVVCLEYICTLSTMATSPVTGDPYNKSVCVWSSTLKSSFVYLIAISSILYV